jgi:hypothetical protein
MAEDTTIDPKFEEWFARRQKEDAERDFNRREYDHPEGKSLEEIEAYLRALWQEYVVKPNSEGYDTSEFGDGTFHAYVEKLATDDFYKGHLMAIAYEDAQDDLLEVPRRSADRFPSRATPKKTSRLLRPKIADELPAQEAATTTGSVLDFVQRYSNQVQQSDKEAPEDFSDLRPIDGPVDPGYFFVPDALSGSRTQQNSVNIGNNRVFLKRYGDEEGVFPLRGNHGSFGVAVRISAISTPMLDDFKGLIEDYPSLDDEETSKAEHELIDEAWNDWAHFDFIRALETHLPDQEPQIDALDEDQARELFDRVRIRMGVEWTEDSGGVYIDVVPVATNVTPEDLAASEPKIVQASSEADDLEARRAEAKEFAAQLREQDSIKRAPGVSFHNLLTKDQVLKVYDFAGMNLDKLPTKPGQVTLLPSPIEKNVTIRITKSDKKSTYDKPLWLCEHVAGIQAN